jgi:hypothetical protein
MKALASDDSGAECVSGRFSKDVERIITAKAQRRQEEMVSLIALAVGG